MKLLAKILLVLLLFSCACSHTTGKFVNQYHRVSFLTDNRDLQVRSSTSTLQLKLSHHTRINLYLKSIAAYVQSADINRDLYFQTDKINNQPWAVCNISF